MSDFNTSKENRGASTLVASRETPNSVAASLDRREWLRISEATRCFGIGRSSLYELIGEGKIKSASVRKRGNVRGIRLVSADSLSKYIESLAEQPAS